MDKLILFPEATSKSDLVANKNYISVLDSMCLECKLNKRLDSNHVSTITLESNLAKDIVNLLSKKQVIKVLSQGVYDYYNIVSIDTSLDNIEITCRHWTIESQNSMFIVDSKPKNLGSLAMLDWLKTATEQYKMNKQYARDLEVGGNITDLVSTNTFHDNFYNATNKLIELYGAECKREGFKVELLDYVGSKNVKYKVEYAVNLLENTTSNDFDITLGVLAKGYDKLYADNIVYSGLLTSHPNAMGLTKEIEYPIRVREEGKEDEEGYIYYDTEAEAKAELEKLAAEEFTVNKIDMPLIEHNTKFIDLSLTEEHKGELKTFIDIGDKVNTVIPQYNLDIETRVIEMVIDILSDEIEDITLSNNDIKDLIPPTINSIKQEIAKLPSINDVINIAKEESLNTVMQGFNGYAYYFPNFTAWMDSDDIKKAKNGLIANKNGWFFTTDGVNPSSDKVTMIADINGNFSANVINTGELRASLIKVGILSDVTNKTWINMENGTFNFADKIKFDGTNCVFDFSGNDVANSGDIDNAKKDLREDYQNAKVTVNKDGVDVKNGALTVTNNSGTVVIDGKHNIHKIIAEGSTSVYFDSSQSASEGQTANVTITHNLGYKPCFSCYVQSDDGWSFPFPYIEYTNQSADFLAMNVVGRAWSDNTRLEIVFRRSLTLAQQGSKRYYIKYFIYKEVAF